jgi:branched-chain amino acid transport system substrate-binding protein
VGTGPEGYAQALALIKEGKPIKYIGATGPIEFDQFGDVAGPMLIWSVKGDKVEVQQTMTIADINEIMKLVDR